MPPATYSIPIASLLARGLVQTIFSSPGATNIEGYRQRLISAPAELKILCNKHGIARRYFFLDDQGRCYVHRESRYQPAEFATELAKLEAALKQLGETLESVYDDAYIARKDAALRRAGIEIVRLEVEPQETTVN